MTLLIAAISFDPTIRGILVMAVATVALPGTIFMIISTNTGVKLGILISLTGLFAWMFLMSSVWWMYGIGLTGRDPAWQAIEVNMSRDDDTLTEQVNSLPRPEDLPDPIELLDQYPDIKAEAMEDPAFAALVESDPEEHRLTLSRVASLDSEIREDLNEDLGGWRISSEQDTRRGETTAAADAVLGSDRSTGVTGFTGTADYFVEDVFYYGGKQADEPALPDDDESMISRGWTRFASIFEPKNPELLSVVTVRQAKNFEVDPAKPPPPTQPRTDVDAVSVIQLRNLGDKRFVPALLTVVNLVLFVAFAYLLHHRDKVQMAMVKDHELEKDWTMGQFLPVLALVVLGALFAGISSLMGRLLNPPQPNPRKNAPYECGIVDQVDVPSRFPVKFYLVAMIFIVFDIEIIFLYPFTQIFRELGGFGLGDIVLFSATLFIPFLFLVSNGALDWGPIKRLRNSDIRVGAHRTTSTTVRRVGTEGRGAVVDLPTHHPETEAA